MPSILERTVMCEQCGPEWFQARLGCMTSSRVAAGTATLKRKEGEAAIRRNMRYELLGERLTGKATEHYVSRWMKEGKEKEPQARTEYELRFDVIVEQVGFVYHPTIKFAGTSPDGLVGSDGIIEIKAPMLDTHLEYLENNVIPEEYLPQMLWQLACCDDRNWIDFVSYHPHMPEPWHLFTMRLIRDEEVNAVIRGMESEVVQFLSEVEKQLQTIKERR